MTAVDAAAYSATASPRVDTLDAVDDTADDACVATYSAVDRVTRAVDTAVSDATLDAMDAMYVTPRRMTSWTTRSAALGAGVLG